MEKQNHHPKLSEVQRQIHIMHEVKWMDLLIFGLNEPTNYSLSDANNAVE